MKEGWRVRARKHHHSAVVPILHIVHLSVSLLCCVFFWQLARPILAFPFLLHNNHFFSLHCSSFFCFHSSLIFCVSCEGRRFWPSLLLSGSSVLRQFSTRVLTQVREVSRLCFAIYVLNGRLSNYCSWLWCCFDLYQMIEIVELLIVSMSSVSLLTLTYIIPLVKSCLRSPCYRWLVCVHTEH